MTYMVSRYTWIYWSVSQKMRAQQVLKLKRPPSPRWSVRKSQSHTAQQQRFVNYKSPHGTVTEGPSHQPGIIFLYIRCNYIKFIRFYCCWLKYHIGIYCFASPKMILCMTSVKQIGLLPSKRFCRHRPHLIVVAESYQQISASASPFVSRHMMGSSPEIPNMLFRVSSFMIAGELGASGRTTVGSSPGQKKIPSGYLT